MIKSIIILKYIYISPMNEKKLGLYRVHVVMMTMRMEIILSELYDYINLRQSE